MKKPGLIVIILVLTLTATLDISAQTNNYVQYRTHLIESLHNYIDALEIFKSDDLESASQKLRTLNGHINRSQFRENGYYPVLSEKIHFYITIINHFPELNRIISSIGTTDSYTEQQEYIEAYNQYSDLLLEAQENNPFSDFEGLDINITTNFEQDIIRRIENEILSLSSITEREENEKIKLCLIPFDNESGDNNLNYLSQSLVDSVGCLLQSYQIFEPHSLSELGIEDQSYSENLDSRIISGNITIIIKGEFTTTSNGDLETDFQAIDIQHDNLFIDVNIVGDTGLGIFSLIDNIGNKLAFLIETYSPQTFIDTAYISQSNSETRISPFSEQGYIPFLESKINAIKEQGTIYYLNLVLLDDSQDDFINEISSIFSQINIIKNDLNVSQAEIETYAGEKYNEIMDYLEYILMEECGITVSEIEDYMENGNYRNGLRRVNKASDNLVEIIENYQLSQSFIRISRRVRQTYERGKDQLNRMLVDDWESLGLSLETVAGYPFLFGRTSFIESAEILIPDINFGISGRIPLSNYHIFIPVGIGFNYMKTDLSSSYLPDGYSLDTQFYLIEASVGFLYEVFWNFFLGCMISGGFGFTTFKNNVADIEPSINDNEVVTPGNASLSVLVEYNFIPEFNIFLMAKSSVIFDKVDVHVVISPCFGIRYSIL